MTEKIRVLYTITDLGKGGAERAITDLCAEFQKRDDIEFIIGSLGPDNAYESTSEAMNVRFLEYEPNSLFKKPYTRIYHEIIDEFKPHIIHSNRFLGEFITVQRVDPGIVFVTHGHDNMIQLQNFSMATLFSKQLLLNYIEKWQLVTKKYNRSATHFVANSEHTYAYYKEVLPPKTAKKVRLLEYGFNFDKFYNPNPKSIQANQKIRIINIGSFAEKKNQTFIVDIAKELLKLNVNFEITLLGDGELRPQVQQKVKDYYLEDYIKFPGIVDNVEEWLWESDIYLHSAWYEPFGLVFLEAMAAGLPIVTLNGLGNKGLVVDFVNGFFIDQQDAKLFATRIREIVIRKGLYKEFSENGKEKSAKYDIKTKALEYIDFYKEIIR
ncbi:MAG: glycosyltransferase family 4 protein [Flavobacteriales bacterium]|nr:glycosyltransferase family 4 protein [Flavobacteriales bacterium]